VTAECRDGAPELRLGSFGRPEQQEVAPDEGDAEDRGEPRTASPPFVVTPKPPLEWYDQF
jgi:hypothetical protein